jgi:hypothetical protein
MSPGRTALADDPFDHVKPFLENPLNCWLALLCFDLLFPLCRQWAPRRRSGYVQRCLLPHSTINNSSFTDPGTPDAMLCKTVG